MNRKFQNSLTAFSASGLALMAALLAAGPVTSPTGPAAQSQGTALAAASAAAVPGTLALAARVGAIEARNDAKTSVLEAGMNRNAEHHAGTSLVGVLAFAAEISTEAALAAALQSARSRQQAADTDDTQRRRRHARQVRSALAVPYFSFARGLRHGAGN